MRFLGYTEYPWIRKMHFLIVMAMCFCEQWTHERYNNVSRREKFLELAG
jgi:hypothetical protein